MTFAEQVKKVRKTLGLTQQELADELNISFSTLNRWERGLFEPHKMARQVFNNFCEEKGISISKN